MTVEKMMEKIFSPTGILCQKGYAYRPKQAEYAKAYGRHLDKPHDPTARPDLLFAEVGTGVGKTIPTVLALAVSYLLHGRRGIIATHTKALRDEITSETMMSLVAAVLSELGLCGSVTIGTYESISDIADHDTIKQILADAIQQGKHVAAASLLEREVYNREVAGEILKLSDWIDSGNDLSFVTDLGYEKSVLGIDFRTFKNKVARIGGEFEAFAQRKTETKGASIIVSTHAMFAFNNATLGAVFSTNKKKVKILKDADLEKFPDSFSLMPQCDVFNVVIDEADQFPDQASGQLTCDFSLAEIDDLFSLSGKRRSVHLKKLRDALEEITNSKSEACLYENTDFKALLVPLAKVYDSILTTFHINGSAKERLMAQSLLERMFRILLWYWGEDNDFRKSIYNYTSPFIRVSSKNQDFRVALDLGYTGSIAAKGWRNYHIQSFSSFLLLSGTLFDAKGKDQITKSLFGVLPIDSYHALPAIESSGHLSKFVIGRGPSVIWQIQGDDRTFTEEYRKHTVDFINSAFAQDGRSLVLLNSYAAIDTLASDLSGSPIIQKNGQNSASFVNDVLGSNENAVCLFWQGVNFVKDGKTVFDRVVIPLIPFAPLDTGRPMGVISENELKAFWKLRQGVGRIFRKPEDSGEVWIGDTRYQIPESINMSLVGFERGGKSFPRLFNGLRNKSTKAIIWQNNTMSKEVMF